MTELTPSPAGVLLDIDGTLIDSNDAHAESWRRTLAEFGLERGHDEVKKLIGMGTGKLLRAIAELDEGTEQARHMVAYRKKLFMAEYMPRLRAFPQAPELLLRMRDAGLRIAIASSAGEDEREKMLRILDPAREIEFAVPSKEGKRSKPDPDVLEAAIRALGLPEPPAERRAFMLGDTPYDVEAATRAGIGSVALRCGGWRDHSLSGAAAIYDDPAHLLREYAESPFGRFLRRGA